MTEGPDWERVWWEHLIEFLNTWTAAEAVAPDRIRVTLTDSDGTPRDIEILMSPDDWSNLYGTIWGNFDQAAQQVKESLDDLPAEHPFLIYKTYELHPSKTETLPEDPDMKRMRELMREHPEGLGGKWVAFGRDGKEYPFPEVPPRQ